MTPAAVVVARRVRCFNAADVDGLAALYAEEAVHHQGVEPIRCSAARRS